MHKLYTVYKITITLDSEKTQLLPLFVLVDDVVVAVTVGDGGGVVVFSHGCCSLHDADTSL